MLRGTYRRERPGVTARGIALSAAEHPEIHVYEGYFRYFRDRIIGVKSSARRRRAGKFFDPPRAPLYVPPRPRALIVGHVQIYDKCQIL